MFEVPEVLKFLNFRKSGTQSVYHVNRVNWYMRELGGLFGADGANCVPFCNMNLHEMCNCKPVYCQSQKLVYRSSCWKQRVYSHLYTSIPCSGVFSTLTSQFPGANPFAVNVQYIGLHGLHGIQG